MAVRPGTDEVWFGDVGAGTWEEIDRLATPASPPIENFGWPCYEGPDRQPGYDSANLDVCEQLYGEGAGAVVAPHHRYRHADQVVAGEACPTGGSSLAGLAFAPETQGSYPPEYRGALFFADYTRRCIWAMRRGSNGLPDPAQVMTFASGAAQPVDLRFGPGGDLFYVDLGGTVRRVRYVGPGQAPVAVASADPTSGPAPLTVQFDGSASSDPEGQTLDFAWDLDADGAFDDATAATATHTYEQLGPHVATLRVTDPSGASSTASVRIVVGIAPVPVIETPAAGTTWQVGEVIPFSGHATDGQGDPLPDEALEWTVVVHHCPDTCHEHVVQTIDATASGSFVAPDHEYPAHLELRLTATDPAGLSSTGSVQLDPETVQVTFASDPPGLHLTVGTTQLPTPFTRTAIAGSQLSIGAPSPQSLGEVDYEFDRWSDGGPPSHDVVAAADDSLVATYRAVPPVVVPGAASVVEGDAGAVTLQIPVALSAPSPEVVTVDWATVATGDPVPDVDYASATGTLTFSPGDTAEVIEVSVLGDTVDEPGVIFGAEWLFVALEPTNAVLGEGLFAGVAHGFIIDDDPTPIVVGGVGVVVEGDDGAAVLEIPVTLTSASGVTVRVDWFTVASDQPVPGVDYEAANGTLTFPPGDTEEVIEVSVLGDTVDEPGVLYGAEWLFVGLTRPTNAVFGTGFFATVAHGFIADDD
jgi:PKD repeat protein